MGETNDSFGSFLGTSGGGAIASSVLGTVANVISANKQYKRQKQLMKAQYAYQTSEREATQRWQERMWNLGNEYSSPIAQMSRLRQAGLSPDLFYKGSGDFVNAHIPSGSTPSAPSVPTPAGEASSVAGAEKMADTALRIAQIKNINEDTREKGNNIAYTNVLIEHEGKKIMLTGEQIEFTKEQKEYVRARTETAFAEAKKFHSAVLVDNSIVALNQQQLSELKETFSDRFEQLRLTNRSIDTQNKLTDKELNSFEDFMEATIELMNDQAFYAQQAGKKLSLENIDLQKIQEARQKIKVKYFDGKESSYYDTMTNLTVAFMIGDTEMIQKQAELLQRFGAWKAVTDPIIQALGSAAGAYIGARTPRMQEPLKRQPIGFNKN